MLPLSELPFLSGSSTLDLLPPLLADSGVQIGRATGRLHPVVVHFPIALGLVAVGSVDANRFFPGMGTLFIRMMAEALAVAMGRFP